MSTAERPLPTISVPTPCVAAGQRVVPAPAATQGEHGNGSGGHNASWPRDTPERPTKAHVASAGEPGTHTVPFLTLDSRLRGNDVLRGPDERHAVPSPRVIAAPAATRSDDGDGPGGREACWPRESCGRLTGKPVASAGAPETHAIPVRTLDCRLRGKDALRCPGSLRGQGGLHGRNGLRGAASRLVRRACWITLLAPALASAQQVRWRAVDIDIYGRPVQATAAKPQAPQRQAPQPLVIAEPTFAAEPAAVGAPIVRTEGMTAAPAPFGPPPPEDLLVGKRLTPLDPQAPAPAAVPTQPSGEPAPMALPYSGVAARTLWQPVTASVLTKPQAVAVSPNTRPMPVGGGPYVVGGQPNPLYPRGNLAGSLVQTAPVTPIMQPTPAPPPAAVAPPAAVVQAVPEATVAPPQPFVPTPAPETVASAEPPPATLEAAPPEAAPPEAAAPALADLSGTAGPQPLEPIDEPFIDPAQMVVAGKYRSVYDITPYTSRFEDPQEGAEAVRRWILSETTDRVWHGSEAASLSVGPERLTVYHEERVHQHVADLLGRFLHFTPGLFDARVAVLNVADQRWRAGLSHLRPAEIDEPGMQAWYVTEAQLPTLREALRRSGDATAMAAEEVRVANGTETAVAWQPDTSGSYVRAVVPRGNAANVRTVGYNPQTESTRDGVAVTFSPLITPLGDTDLNVELTTRKLADKKSVRLDDPGRPKVEVPEMHTRKLVGRYSLAHGTHLLVSTGLGPSFRDATGPLGGRRQAETLVLLELRAAPGNTVLGAPFPPEAPTAVTQAAKPETFAAPRSRRPRPPLRSVPSKLTAAVP